MTEEIQCWNCRKSFIPGTSYEFPTFTAYWHKCMMGDLTQICVPKTSKEWWERKEMTAEENVNRTLEEFYSFRTDPLLWYKEFHANIRGD